MKMTFMSSTLDTYHSPIDSWGPPKQSIGWSRDNVGQLVTALLSSDLDRGENKYWSTQEFGEMKVRISKMMAWWRDSGVTQTCWLYRIFYNLKQTFVCLPACTVSTLNYYHCHILMVTPQGTDHVWWTWCWYSRIEITFCESRWGDGEWTLSLTVRR